MIDVSWLNDALNSCWPSQKDWNTVSNTKHFLNYDIHCVALSFDIFMATHSRSWNAWLCIASLWANLQFQVVMYFTNMPPSNHNYSYGFHLTFQTILSFLPWVTFGPCCLLKILAGTTLIQTQKMSVMVTLNFRVEHAKQLSTVQP